MYVDPAWSMLSALSNGNNLSVPQLRGTDVNSQPESRMRRLVVSLLLLSFLINAIFLLRTVVIVVIITFVSLSLSLSLSLSCSVGFVSRRP